MSFQSVNELDKLSFDDCELTGAKIGETVEFTAEALIIKGNNSQNSNYTDSYADTALVRFTEAQIVSLKKEGYREYDAMDRIVNEVEDEMIPAENYGAFFKLLSNVYLFEVTKNEDAYTLRIEFPGTDEISPCTDTYEMVIKASSLVVSWERYLNRVQY